MWGGTPPHPRRNAPACFTSQPTLFIQKRYNFSQILTQNQKCAKISTTFYTQIGVPHKLCLDVSSAQKTAPHNTHTTLSSLDALVVWMTITSPYSIVVIDTNAHQRPKNILWETGWRWWRGEGKGWGWWTVIIGMFSVIQKQNQTSKTRDKSQFDIS